MIKVGIKVCARAIRVSWLVGQLYYLGIIGDNLSGRVKSSSIVNIKRK